MKQEPLTLLENHFPDVILKPVHWKDEKMEHRAEGFYAVVDRNTGKIFSVVSQDYRLIRHENAIEEVELAISTNPDLGKYLVSTAFYNAGARMRHTYMFPSVSANITPGDVINLQLHLYNSYDMTWPFIVTLGAFRVVCSNGLVVRVTYYHFKRRHIFDLADVALLDNLSDSVARFRAQAAKWNRWAEIPLTEKVYDNVMKSMRFGINAVLEIEEEAQRLRHTFVDGVPMISLWAFFNLITWYITHRAVSLNHRVTMENRLRVAMRCFRA
jgi:hypothetical protein